MRIGELCSLAGLTAITIAAIARPSIAATQTPVGFDMTPEQFWHAPFGTGPRMPLAGDADGDGRADLLSLWPVGGGVIDMARTSALGKPTYGNVARSGFGNDGITDACGPFVRNAADFLSVFADGSIRVAWGMSPGTNLYQHDDLAGRIPAAAIPRPPARAAVADFDGDGRVDVLILDRDGKLLLLQNERGADGVPRFTPRPLTTTLPGVRQFAAGQLAGAARGQCVWLDKSGQLSRAFVDLTSAGGASLGAPTPVLKASPDDHIAVGRFRGQGEADILVGQRLLPGGDPTGGLFMPGIPAFSVAIDDGPWVAADVDGNGKDDLVRFRRGKERFGGEDTFVHFAFDARDQSKGYYCSSNDGLPDFWKMGVVKPGGLDLPALGCRVGHRDIIVEVERFEDVAEDALRSNLDTAARYFASLPIRNPDGSTGISLHFIYRKPWPKSVHDDIMRRFDDLFPPTEQRGIVHTVFAENDGPLVSKNCGDNGHFNGHWPEFLHEFGHQLDLSHGGFWPTTNCALYPSLMSYTYSYGLNDKGDDIGYSDGSRAAFVINELHLSERLPFPIEKVRFLSGSPYHFRILSTPDGKGTLVDWNWNGLLGEEDVSADVNYDHGLDFGPRYDVARAQSAPVLVAHGDGPKPRLLLLYGQSLPGAPAGSGSISPARPGRLVMRVWLGTNRDTEGARWSEEVVVEKSGVTGDASAVYLGNDVSWVVYPTRAGVLIRPITMGADRKPIVGAARLVSGTAGVEPTLAVLGNRLALLLWRSPEAPVGLCTISVTGTDVVVAREMSLNVQSQAPVGAVGCGEAAEPPSFLIGRIETQGPQRGHTEVIRWELGADGLLRAVQRNWVDGIYSTHRMTLLWQPERGLGRQGRIFQFSGGITRPEKPWAEQYITMNVPYHDMGGGWLYRRYFDNDFASVSAPGACFYDGNIVYAIRLHDGSPDHNDAVGISFYGSGATPTPMGDFDDISHIRDYGLSHSIPEVSN